jgi:hypothetical protein
VAFAKRTILFRQILRGTSAFIGKVVETATAAVKSAVAPIIIGDFGQVFGGMGFVIQLFDFLAFRK